MKRFAPILALILVAVQPSAAGAEDYVPEPVKSRFNVELMNERQNGHLGCALMGQFAIMELGPDRPVVVSLLVASGGGTIGAGLSVAEVSPRTGEPVRLIRVRSFEFVSSTGITRVDRLKKVSDDKTAPRVGEVSSQEARAVLEAHNGSETVEIRFEGAPKDFPARFRYRAELNPLDSAFLESCLKRLP